MFVQPSHRFDRAEKLDYLLRRAEQEAIAAIRAPDERASNKHAEMALTYSALATTMLDQATNG